MGLAGQCVMAAAIAGIIRVERVQVHCRQTQKRLDGGTRRIASGQSAVEQRLVGIGFELAITAVTQPGSKQIGIERGRTDQRQHVSRAGFDRNHRAPQALHGLLGSHLQPNVDADNQVVAGDGPARVQVPCNRIGLRRDGSGIHQHAPLGVDQLLAESDRAVQHILVTALDAADADESGRRVIGAVDPFHVIGADAAQVADGVPGQIAVGIVANQALANVDAAESMASHRESRRLGFGQIRQHDPFEPPVRIDRTDQVFALRRIKQLQDLQRIQRRLQIDDLLGNCNQLPCGQVLGQQLSVTIEYQAPRRRQGFDSHSIALGQFGEGFVVGDLDLEQSPDQYAAHCNDQNGGKHQPRNDQSLFLPAIPDLYLRSHRYAAFIWSLPNPPSATMTIGHSNALESSGAHEMAPGMAR